VANQNGIKNKGTLSSAIQTLEQLLDQNKELLERMDADQLAEPDSISDDRTPEEALQELPTLIDVVEPKHRSNSSEALPDEIETSQGMKEIMSPNLEEIIYTEIRKATNNVQNAILKEVNSQLELTLQTLNQVKGLEETSKNPDQNIKSDVGVGQANNEIKDNDVEKVIKTEKQEAVSAITSAMASSQQIKTTKQPEQKQERSQAMSPDPDNMKKTYDPQAIEQRWYYQWEEKDYFKHGVEGEPY